MTIDFGIGDSGADLPWVALSQTGARLMSGHAALPLPWRLMLLAVGNMNQIGHAEFGGGELARLLRISPDAVTERIRAAKRYGLLADESCARCIVLPAEIFQRGRGTTVCGWHGIGERYRRERLRPRRDYGSGVYKISDKEERVA